MGACTFSKAAKKSNEIPTAEKAFALLTAEARTYHGNNPYSGSIATKESFVHCGEFDTAEEARLRIEEMLNNEHPDIDDPWGPAGCMAVGDKGWIFFGWAKE